MNKIQMIFYNLAHKQIYFFDDHAQYSYTKNNTIELDRRITRGEFYRIKDDINNANHILILRMSDE